MTNKIFFQHLKNIDLYCFNKYTRNVMTPTPRIINNYIVCTAAGKSLNKMCAIGTLIDEWPSQALSKGKQMLKVYQYILSRCIYTM